MERKSVLGVWKSVEKWLERGIGVLRVRAAGWGQLYLPQRFWVVIREGWRESQTDISGGRLDELLGTGE